ncbi:MAG: rod shape-determining protein MreD [Chloroflexi bacterium]|nr:rod shape-determining protein MreD [Chloroflexota bacterium]MCC6891845.1 rod shape-determining protein MreD [Anaerolineae bacterium]
MGSFLSLPILMLAAAIQVTVMPQISIFGGRPDIVLLIVSAWSLNTSLEQGVLWAFVGGICKDLLSAAPIGTSIVGMVLIIFAIHAIRQQLFSVGFFTLVWVSVLGTIIQQFTILIILLSTGFQPQYVDQLGYGVVLDQIRLFIVPSIVYNLIGIMPVYWFVRAIQRALGTDLRLTR